MVNKLIKKRDSKTGRILPKNYDLNKIIICICGCGQRIILNRGHFYRKQLPRYLPYHCSNTWVKKGSIGLSKGKKHSEETKRLISEHSSHHPSWNKGTHKSGMDGKKHSELTKQKMSESAKKRGFTELWWESLMKSHSMNFKKSSLEKKFEEIINKFNLPYRFVGHGDFLVGMKNPDFINVNGEKIAIEVYCIKHKIFFQAKEGIDNWKLNRSQIFAKYGWKIEFFDETQINEKEILKRLITNE